MKLNLARGSLLLFALCLVLLIMLTVFESALVGISLGAERVITIVGLVLLPGIGAVLGVMSLVRKEGRAVLATIGIVLNTLFALFHALVVLFAG